MKARLRYSHAILAASLVAGCGATGCGGNSPPVIDPLADQRAFVNVELALTVTASDPDGDALSFGFTGDIPGIDQHATLSDTTNARAVFHWVPLASEVGQHSLDFEVSDGALASRITIALEVGVSGEGAGAPVFVQPLGSGTTVDVRQESCLEVPVAVEDPDSTGVTLGQEEPLIEGAQLEQLSELAGTWSFCPTPEQIAADDRYTLTLSADDGEHDKTVKSYLIVLRTDTKPDCPGEAPVVTHTPQDAITINDVTITAEVSDDQGIKYEPLFYYTTTPPADPPDVTTMTQLTMTQVAGDMLSGTWSADVPNPVASQTAGSTAQLYYVIVAQDNDDPDGNCDHRTDAGTFSITVTNPGGSGGKGLCESCTADAQCGDADDNCVFLGGGYHCFTGCQSNTDCSSGYYCSFSQFTSIDNTAARQCIPNNYTCTTTTPSCVDDNKEENDTLAVASSKAALATGNHANLKSCPANSGDDEDWYKIQLTGDRQVSLSLAGGAATDLDLALYNAQGALIVKSDSLSSTESLSRCMTQGTYYVRVYAYGIGENSYSLGYTATATSCAPMCTDDGAENDDNATQARPVDLNMGVYHSNTNAICSWDDDWYAVPLYNGETVYVSLTFTQDSSTEDLDIYIYKGSTNLTGCSEATPMSCDPFNGQSGSSNEFMAWPITQTGTYYIVVHGWNGSENLYDICIGLSALDCP